MRNVWLILRREYLERVRTKTFIISTLILPAFMLAITVLPSTFANMKTSRTKKLVLVVSAPEFGGLIRQELTERAKDIGSKYDLILELDTTERTRESLGQRVLNNELDGYLWATDDVIKENKSEFVGRDTADFIENASLGAAINVALMKRRLIQRGIPAQELSGLLQRVNIETVRLSSGTPQRQSGPAMFVAALAMVMMLYVTLLVYGQSVMRAVLEEKTSRIVEVILSSATSLELMAGKILGVGAVGLTQVLIWAIMAAVIAVPAVLSASLEGLNISWTALAYFPVFFVLGYLLYSALFAALGALVTSEQEAQNFTFFVMLPIVASVILMFFVMRQPSASASVLLSMVPFFAPILMYMRIVVQQPPLWEIALCILLLSATVYLLTVICARVYRVGVLMYGKRPTLPEIVRWARYA
jgi:ABC-2 type transport system permease protein